MKDGRKLMTAMLMMFACCSLYTTGFFARFEKPPQMPAETSAPPAPSETPGNTPLPVPETVSQESEAIISEPELAPAMELTDRSGIIETTISGGMTVKNQTDYIIDTAALTENGAGTSLSADGPQILIFHTHSSEAYTQAGLDRYEPSDRNRTEDTEFNIIRVGDELTKIYEDAGLRVIHDREVYDYPSYTGSYTRSGTAVQKILDEYPCISVVIDMHRDALGDDDVVYKTMAEESGVVSSQVMMLVGTDGSGLEHPNWRQNLTLVLYLQNAVTSEHPTLMRPVNLVPQRYNQQLSPGMFILEVGSSGNTLQEALAAIRLYGRSTAPALAELAEK